MSESKSKIIGEGGYVFLSHSHDDITIVRRLRNILEENGMDALCFYLKCLEDDTEVFDLIKREIDARKQFVFIESENSKRSVWVGRERTYVKQCEDKIIHTVPIDDITVSPIDAAKKILFSMRIYVSYRKKDRIVRRLADTLITQLMDQDFQVAYDDLLDPDAEFTAQLQTKMKEACEFGAFVILLSELSLEPYYQMNYEYPTAVELGGFIIPVWVGQSPWASVKEEFSRSYRWLEAYPVIDCSGDYSSVVPKVIEAIQKYDG